MDVAALLDDGFDRVREETLAVLDGLTQEQLNRRLGPDANHIGWLVWHLTRVQDDHVSEVADVEQVWTAQDWAARFGLPFDDVETGYAQDSVAVGDVEVSAELLRGYFEAVDAQTRAYVAGLREDDLDRIVDERWDPPVTLGVRLISVISDDLQHVGQAMFIRGIVT